VEKGPAPGWVQVAEQNFPAGGAKDEGSVRYLLADIQVHAEEKYSYEAFATRIVTAAGVEDYSQISIDFQPTYQTLVLHHLDVIRESVAQDRLAAAEIQVIRREEGMEEQLYNGALTAHIILNDVRPGDIVSYSYTIKGENPIFKGHTHFIQNTAYSIPVDRIRRSIIWNPKVRTLAWKVPRSEPELEQQDLADGLRSLSYDGSNVPKFETEKNTPYWFRDYPHLEISDYGSWEEFGKWTATIYSDGDSLPPEIVEVCDGIRKAGGTPAEQAVKALRWVQGNIRYLGSFFGEHTHEPYPLAEICRRRFGDCKDKGMLTVAMLRNLGLDAAPALVNTSLRNVVDEMLPGHSDFDHLIVHLSLDGKDYWLDPTRTNQRGTLENQFNPDYGRAFVIRLGADSLTAVMPSGVATARTDIYESFIIKDEDGNGTLTVKTISSGIYADNMRSTFDSNSRAELEEDYRDYYEEDYPGLEIAEPLEVTDDEMANSFTTIEHYRLRNILAKPETPGGLANAAIYARSISSYLDAPESKKRKNPFRLSHPVIYTQTIDVTLPQIWEVEPKNVSVSLPSLTYNYKLSHTGRKLTLAYNYQSLNDNVQPEDFAKYYKAMKNAESDIYFPFTYPLASSGTAPGAADDSAILKSHVLLGVFLILGAFVGLAISIALYFWDPPARSSSSPQLRGIGGWLILPTLGCFLYPIITIIVVSSFFTHLGLDDVNLFSGAESQTQWRIYYCTSVFAEGIQLPLLVLQLVLLMKHRTSFPYIYIGLAVLNLASLLLNYGLQSSVDSMASGDEVATEFITTVLKLGLWCLYMFVSERVRATFIKHRNTPAAPQPPPLPV